MMTMMMIIMLLRARETLNLKGTRFNDLFDSTTDNSDFGSAIKMEDLR
jgi:hypothetical protein